MEEESKTSKLHELRTLRMQGLWLLFRRHVDISYPLSSVPCFSFFAPLQIILSSKMNPFALFRPRHRSFSSHSFNSFVSNSLEDALWRWQGLLNLVEHDQRRVTYRRSRSEKRRMIGMVGRSEGSIEIRIASMFVCELKRDQSAKIQWNFDLIWNCCLSRSTDLTSPINLGRGLVTHHSCCHQRVRKL